MSKKFVMPHIVFLEYINTICQNPSVSAADTIVCIGRGGYIPGTYISHKTGIKEVYTIVAKSYTDDNMRGELQFLQAPTLDDHNQKILIVDDIVDSGTSIVYPSKELIFASVVYKEQSEFSDVVYGIVAPQDEWVVFPWES